MPSRAGRLVGVLGIEVVAHRRRLLVAQHRLYQKRLGFCIFVCILCIDLTKGPSYACCGLSPGIHDRSVLLTLPPPAMRVAGCPSSVVLDFYRKKLSPREDVTPK
jgi:hypothetical protein